LILLASLTVGLVAYLAVGLLMGYLPRIATRVAVPKRKVRTARPPAGRAPVASGPGRVLNKAWTFYVSSRVLKNEGSAPDLSVR